MVSKPVCAVVGAGPGIGFAVAARFAEEGFAPLLISRGGTALDALVAGLKDQGIDAGALAVNARDPAQVATALSLVPDVEVLVYNAFGSTMHLPTSLAPDQLIDDLKINVVSALAAAQAVAPAMRDAGRGTILLTGGGLSISPVAILASLSIGKAALRSLAYLLAEELRPAGIRVGTVTVMGQVRPDSAFAPETIARTFWALHQDRDYTLGVETPFSGA